MPLGSNAKLRVDTVLTALAQAPSTRQSVGQPSQMGLSQLERACTTQGSERQAEGQRMPCSRAIFQTLQPTSYATQNCPHYRPPPTQPCRHSAMVREQLSRSPSYYVEQTVWRKDAMAGRASLGRREESGRRPKSFHRADSPAGAHAESTSADEVRKHHRHGLKVAQRA